MKGCAVIFLGLLVFASNAQATKRFQFIYIEASEGNASGGHVAVQMGDEVYHYQYEDALIRLFKQDAEVFRDNYRLAQNRNLHIADIEVTDTAYERLSSHFKDRFYEQKQKLKQLQALQQDQALLQALLKVKVGKQGIATEMPELSQKLPGTGLFYGENYPTSIKKPITDCDTRTASANVLAEVNRQLAEKYGEKYLSQRINTLSKTIRQLSPVAGAEALSSNYPFSKHYGDSLNGLLALKVLQDVKPMMPYVCFQVNLTGTRLADADKSHLKDFQQSVVQSSVSLLNSTRPDWGYALMLSLARLISVEHSLETGQWTFLDDTDETTSPISGQQLALYAKQMQKQRHVDLVALQAAVSALAKTGIDERHYAQLEIAANRYQQWLISDQTGAVRFRSEQALPNKRIALAPYLMTDLTEEQLASFIRYQKATAGHLFKENNGRNAYHLVTNNCVTELFRLINQAVSGQSEQLLGGYVDPQVNFIPFQAFEAVQEAYNVVKVSIHKAYREQELIKLYGREVDSWVYARESNIFSSSLYNYNPDDAWFVFFTDDAVLPRPLFGAVNTLAATSQSVWGLMRWPFDGSSRELIIGLRGVLTSLPELAFFNIRKGSYPYPIRH